MRGFRPSIHLRRLAAAAASGRTATICIVGDSTSTHRDEATGIGGANAVAPSELLWPHLVRAIRADNPGRPIRFVNRAIGGQRWATLAAIPQSNRPSWYGAPDLPWLAYVRATCCDTLFVNFGVNDTDRLTVDIIRNVLAEVVAWGSPPKPWAAETDYPAHSAVLDAAGRLCLCPAAGRSGFHAPFAPGTPAGPVADGTLVWHVLTEGAYVAGVPDIVLITNKNASRSAKTAHATPSHRAGTLTAAAFQRTLALSGGAALGIDGLPPLGLIDIGRYFTQIYNGFDPARQFLQRVLPPEATVSLAPSHDFPPSPGGDVDLELLFAGQATTLADSALLVHVGGHRGVSALTLRIERRGMAALVSFGTDAIRGSVATGSAAIGGAWGASDLAIRITAKQEALRVQVNGIVVLDALLPRFIGPFAPAITLDGSPGISARMTILSFAVGHPLPTAALFDDDLTFGLPGYGTGGNGINHTASPSIAAVDATVLEALDFCVG